MELSELKASREMLLSVLKQDKPGQHLICPFHEDRNGSLSVWNDDGRWNWKCHAGCGGGTIIDAAMLAYHATSFADAMRVLERELGLKIGKDEEIVRPNIDSLRAESFIQHAHQRLMDDFDIQEEYMQGKRGITDLSVIARYRVGFVVGAKFKGKTYKLTGWTLPITEEDGQLVGVKIHTEKLAWPKAPKCLWAPFGTYPADKPKHGAKTLWPPPEHFKGCERLYFHPGELKALAVVASGLPATAPTSGEGGHLEKRLVQRIKNVGAKQIMVCFDDDDPKRRPNGEWVSAGNEWRKNVMKCLEDEGVPCLPFAFNHPTPVPAVDVAALQENWNAVLQASSDVGAGGLTGANLELMREIQAMIDETGYESVGFKKDASAEDLRAMHGFLEFDRKRIHVGVGWNDRLALVDDE